MKYTVKTKKQQAEITITLEGKEWTDAIEEAYKKTKNKYEVQGFSKGKAPRKLIEKYYGETTFYDAALDGCFFKYYFEILSKEKNLEPIDAPNLNITEVSENKIVIVAAIDTKPEVILGAYKGLTVPKSEVKITDKMVKDELEKVRQNRARFEKVTRVAKLGDFATINFVGTVDGKKFEGGQAENYELELGSHSFIDTFEDQIVGMKPGDKKDIKVNFPKDYQVDTLKAKPAVFAVTLKEVKEKVLPTLDDSFISDISEFGTLKEFEADLKKKIEDHAKHEAEHKQEFELLDKVAAGAKVEVPDILVERQVDDYIADFEYRLKMQGLNLQGYLDYTGLSIEQLRDSRKEDAKKTVKLRLVLEEIIRIEKITVTDKDIEDKFNEFNKDNPKKIDEIKKTISDEQLAYFENNVLMGKVIKLLKSNNNL
ncbi:MAG: trigger factor [Christensenellaceae bacterium]|nr:trigger factor [Christensenellaceae bacterium]